jgi:hypothetical protein
VGKKDRETGFENEAAELEGKCGEIDTQHTFEIHTCCARIFCLEFMSVKSLLACEAAGRNEGFREF